MADPMNSPMWADLSARFFQGAAVHFSDKVKLTMPGITENQHQFPVMIDGRAVPGATRMILFEDLNPIPLSVDYQLQKSAAVFATCIKLDQRTPVRGAVLGPDGWHVASQRVDAAGGGCSAPPLSRVRGDWHDHLGELRGAAWPHADGVRLRLTIRHPMDTGLVENIAAYNLEELSVRNAAGDVLATLSIFGSVAEDPVFTFSVPGAAGDQLMIEARDTGGVRISGQVAVPRVSPFPAEVRQ